MVGEEKGEKRTCNEQQQRDENTETLKEEKDGGREKEIERVPRRKEGGVRVGETGEEEKRC